MPVPGSSNSATPAKPLGSAAVPAASVPMEFPMTSVNAEPIAWKP